MAGIFVVWMALAGKVTVAEIVVGLVVSGGVALLSLPHLAMLDDVKLSPSLPVSLIRYFAVFFWALLRANLDVARRVAAPRVQINPAIVEVHTELGSDLGKLWLANSITLTPGTLCVDVVGETLKVHWIDISPGADIEHATREIAARFEGVLKEFLR
ncbi:MAG TPA: cation transporter [Rhizobiales bacterium]|nr:cation transporter [Hyphomicrobiales bacterium]